MGGCLTKLGNTLKTRIVSYLIFKDKVERETTTPKSNFLVIVFQTLNKVNVVIIMLFFIELCLFSTHLAII